MQVNLLCSPSVMGLRVKTVQSVEQYQVTVSTSITRSQYKLYEAAYLFPTLGHSERNSGTEFLRWE